MTKDIDPSGVDGGAYDPLSDELLDIGTDAALTAYWRAVENGFGVMHTSNHSMRAALRAGYSAIVSAQSRRSGNGGDVRVKALSWKKTGKVLWTAETFYGTYGIERQSDEIGHTFWCWFKLGGWSAETVSGYNSDLAAAKASAQGEHERNILSALEVKP